MKQVRAVLEFPRDRAHSIIYELRYISPIAICNYHLVLEMFIEIDDSLGAAIKRKVDDG